MIEVEVRDEIGAILNKSIIAAKMGRCLREIGYDVDKYILTEYFNEGAPDGYKIKFYKGEIK